MATPTATRTALHTTEKPRVNFKSCRRSGLEAWRKLKARHESTKELSHVSALLRALQPPNVKDLKVVLRALDHGEEGLRRQEENIGGPPLNDATQRAIMAQMAPDNLGRHLRLNARSLNSCEKMEIEVANYVILQVPSATAGMDVDKINEDWEGARATPQGKPLEQSAGGSRGCGKGDAKGGFEGVVVGAPSLGTGPAVAKRKRSGRARAQRTEGGGNGSVHQMDDDYTQREECAIDINRLAGDVSEECDPCQSPRYTRGCRSTACARQERRGGHLQRRVQDPGGRKESIAGLGDAADWSRGGCRKSS